jgi:hypothetical protein
MKHLTILSTTVLTVLLGISAPVYAQDEARPQEDKQAAPDAKAAHEDKQVEKDKQEDKADKDKEKQQLDKDKENKQAVQEDKTTQEKTTTRADQHTSTQSGRIPDEKFRANFGRTHTFSIGHPTIVSGTPRFQYGGYWFVIAQPWPAGWAYTDVVYVDFIDGGYYLLSPVHPGIQISINVVL